MAHRADAADARRDGGHLIKRAAFGKLLEAAHLGHVKMGVGDVPGIVQIDIDFGVPFDASDGIDDKFSHGRSPTRISLSMPAPACGPRSVLPARRRWKRAREDSPGCRGPP